MLATLINPLALNLRGLVEPLASLTLGESKGQQSWETEERL